MADAYGQRTPTIGLKVESDDTRNFNWSHLDEVIARAFTPDSPLQIPPDIQLPDQSVSQATLYPGATVYQTAADDTVSTGFLTLNTETEVARAHNSFGRGGPQLILGTLSMIFANTTAGALPADLRVRTYMPGADDRFFTVHANIPPGEFPVVIPIIACYTFTAFTGVADAIVTLTKTTGADAALHLSVTSGRLQAVELS